MKWRKAKRLCKRSIAEYGMKITRTIGSLFITTSNPRVLCMRHWSFAAVPEDSEYLHEFIDEVKTRKKCQSGLKTPLLEYGSVKHRMPKF